MTIDIARDIDDFIANPIGRAVIDRVWLYYYPRPSFCGFLMWGVPEPEDMVQLRRVLEALLEPAIPVHDAIADTRHVEHMSKQSFEIFQAYVKECHARIQKKIPRTAVVRPDGLMGAAAQGFFQIVAPPYAVHVVDRIEDAVAWLGEDSSYATDFTALHEQATSTSGVQRELATLLTTTLGKTDLAAAARALGVSPRALQRELKAAGTSFRTEQQLAQVRAAEKLLLDTDQSVSAIAYSVGCATPAHFSDLFKRLRGVTPSAWRAAKTGGPATSEEPPTSEP